WNGASPERLQALRSDYDMILVQLPENYRCPVQIIDIANKLIAHNRQRTADKKPLAAARPPSMDEGIVRYRAFGSPEDEVAFISQDILGRKLDPTDCVVLARTAKLLEAAAESLHAAGFEAYLTKRKNEFDSAVVRVVFNTLRLANARHDRDVLRRLCVAWDELAGATLELEDVAAAAGLLGGDFLRAWSDAAGADEVSDTERALLARIRESLVDRLDFTGFVEWFLAEGWKSWYQPESRDVAEEMDTWRSLHEDIIREYGFYDLTLNIYLQQMDLASKAPLPSPAAIRCMTIHGSKGLEFKHVYLIGMAQEVFPSFQAVKKGSESREMEEERRNCFVAITRVQETLTLTRARQYNGWSKEPSQFLAEMGVEERSLMPN
ncbi:MAG TPA: ATP-dependent helicase, partial [Thermoanaerobaculia bacterium]|nr:ATP-dependent helicase [Thermoanaerobaculia bacterium]